jgi:hypothetical protein
MSKETMAGLECECGQRIYYREQHLLHCTARRNNGALSVEAMDSKARKIITEVQRDFLREIVGRG